MMFGWFQKKPLVYESLTSAQLTAICDRFWLPGKGDHAEYVLAYNELYHRADAEILDWCRKLIIHSDYWARETGACLLGRLGARGQLGEATAAVIEELGALTRRPIEEDSKETQAIDAALTAFAEIGSLTAVPYLRAVLFSNDEYLAWDTQWTAAEALGRLVGQPFAESNDPPNAARAWLESQDV